MQDGLDRRSKVQGLVLAKVRVLVAGHPKHVVLHHVHPGEQRPQMSRDDLFERDEPLAVGEGDEPGQDRGHLHPSKPPDQRARVPDRHRQVQREVRDVGERVCRVHGQRGQDGQDRLFEDPIQERLPFLVQGIPIEDPHPSLLQGGSDLVGVDLLMAGGELSGPGSDQVQLLGWRQPVDGGNGDAGVHPLVELGHPDLEELVQIRGEDRQELDAFQHRETGVFGDRQHSFVEVEPGQVPVQVTRLKGGGDAEIRPLPRCRSKGVTRL